MAEAFEVADLVELRLDYIEGADVARLLAAKRGEVIVTNRPVREGGKYERDEGERLRTLSAASELGADYVDVELDSVDGFERSGSAKLIVSYHDFERTPEDLADIHRQMIAKGADLAKLAVLATDILDNLKMFDLLARTDFPTIGLCMGEEGQISRILAPRFGSFLTFASSRKGAESASGQLPAADLVDLYRYRKISPDTALYGVIGNPVGHSVSPAIHNAAFEATGLDCVYVPLKVNEGGRFVEEFKRLNIAGYSVTIPHKQSVMAAIDEMDDIVRDIGAMNTIVNRGGRLFGYNTDWSAATKGLEDALAGERSEGPSPLSGKRVVMLGAGGAARGIAFGLRQKGARLTIVNRTASKAEALASEVGCEWRPVEELSQLDAEILVNSTSVGMHPNVDDTPVPKELLRSGMVVFDAVYNPLETRLLREAAECGCKIVTGLDMFVNQAVEQFELWTEQEAPVELMREVVKEALTRK